GAVQGTGVRCPAPQCAVEGEAVGCHDPAPRLPGRSLNGSQFDDIGFMVHVLGAGVFSGGNSSIGPHRSLTSRKACCSWLMCVRCDCRRARGTGPGWKRWCSVVESFVQQALTHAAGAPYVVAGLGHGRQVLHDGGEDVAGDPAHVAVEQQVVAAVEQGEVDDTGKVVDALVLLELTVEHAAVEGEVDDVAGDRGDRRVLLTGFGLGEARHDRVPLVAGVLGVLDGVSLWECVPHGVARAWCVLVEEFGHAGNLPLGQCDLHVPRQCRRPLRGERGRRCGQRTSPTWVVRIVNNPKFNDAGAAIVPEVRGTSTSEWVSVAAFCPEPLLCGLLTILCRLPSVPCGATNSPTSRQP